jgi:hypothetical protein
MDHPWHKPLKETQTDNPIIFHADVGADRLPEITVEQLEQVFPSRKHSLKTWGRAGESTIQDFRKKNRVLEHDPHWIGVRKQTPLHTDPSYPRFSHHLIVKVDDFYLQGMNRVEVPIHRGMFYILDGHSPHQLTAYSKASEWYLAISVDAKEPLPPDLVIESIRQYAETAPFLPEHF